MKQHFSEKFKKLVDNIYILKLFLKLRDTHENFSMGTRNYVH